MSENKNDWRSRVKSMMTDPNYAEKMASVVDNTRKVNTGLMNKSEEYESSLSLDKPTNQPLDLARVGEMKAEDAARATMPSEDDNYSGVSDLATKLYAEERNKRIGKAEQRSNAFSNAYVGAPQSMRFSQAMMDIRDVEKAKDVQGIYDKVLQDESVAQAIHTNANKALLKAMEQNQSLSEEEQKKVYDESVSKQLEAIGKGIDKYLYDINAPKSEAEWVAKNAVNSSIMGQMLTSPANVEGGENAYRQQALADYGSKASWLSQGISMAGSLIIDTLPMMGIGTAFAAPASKAAMWGVGKVGGKALQGSLIGRGVVGSVGGAATLGGYNAASALTTQFSNGQFDLGEITSSAGHGALMGGLTGVMSPVLRGLSQGMGKVGKAATMAGGLGAEAGIFSAAELAEMENPYDFETVAKTFGKNVVVIGGLKLSNPIKTIGEYKRWYNEGKQSNFDDADYKMMADFAKANGFANNEAFSMSADGVYSRSIADRVTGNRTLLELTKLEGGKERNLAVEMYNDPNVPISLKTKIAAKMNLPAPKPLLANGVRVEGNKAITYCTMPNGAQQVIEIKEFARPRNARAFANEFSRTTARKNDLMQTEAAVNNISTEPIVIARLNEQAKRNGTTYDEELARLNDIVQRAAEGTITPEDVAYYTSIVDTDISATEAIKQGIKDEYGVEIDDVLKSDGNLTDVQDKALTAYADALRGIVEQGNPTTERMLVASTSGVADYVALNRLGIEQTRQIMTNPTQRAEIDAQMRNKYGAWLKYFDGKMGEDALAAKLGYDLNNSTDLQNFLAEQTYFKSKAADRIAANTTNAAKQLLEQGGRGVRFTEGGKVKLQGVPYPIEVSQEIVDRYDAAMQGSGEPMSRIVNDALKDIIKQSETPSVKEPIVEEMPDVAEQPMTDADAVTQQMVDARMAEIDTDLQGIEADGVQRMTINGRPVAIIKGRIVADVDGKVDKTKSSTEVAYMLLDENGRPILEDGKPKIEVGVKPSNVRVEDIEQWRSVDDYKATEEQRIRDNNRLTDEAMQMADEQMRTEEVPAESKAEEITDPQTTDELLTLCKGDRELALDVAMDELNRAQQSKGKGANAAETMAINQRIRTYQRMVDELSKVEETPTEAPTEQTTDAQVTDDMEFVYQKDLGENHDGMEPMQLADGRYKWVGLQRGELTATMGERDTELLDGLAKKLGVAIIPIDVADSAVNGYYRDGNVYVNTNRGAEWTMRWVAGHEMLHDVAKKSPEAYNAYKQAVLDMWGEEYVENQVKQIIDDYAASGKTIDREQALTELVNDFGGELFNSRDGLNILDNILKGESRKGNTGFVETIKQWWDKLKEWFSGTPYYKNVEKLLKDAYSEAIANAEEFRRNQEMDKGVSSVTDAARVEGAAIDFSIKTEPQVAQRLREYAESEDGKKHGWDKEKIESIIDETEDLIDVIHNSLQGNQRYDAWADKNPTMRVDWRDGELKQTVTWSRGNVEYKYDMSADLLCINNEALEDVLASPAMVQIVRGMDALSKNGFTSDDYLRIYQVLRDKGFVVPCAGCFDAAARFKMLPSVAKNFADLVNKTIDERNAEPEAFDAKVKAMAKGETTIEGLPTSAKTKQDAIMIGVAGDKLTEHITSEQLMSAQGQTDMLANLGGIFRAWQRTGAGRPKDKLLPEPYVGDINSTTTTIIGAYGERTPSYRDIYVNQGTGLRRNSHSEFRPLLAIDEIQFMRDAFAKGLTVFKYMKELDDVRLFGNMGVKFNMSFFPAFAKDGVAAGLDANGNYIASEESVGSREFAYMGEDGRTHFDGMRGWQEAQKYTNENVSLSSVVFSIPHLIKAMTDVPTPSDKSGMWGSLIPFHSSGATSAHLALQGLGRARANGVGHPFSEAMSDYNKGVTNFEAVQNDRFGEGWVIIEGKKAGTAIENGHKLEFANGTHMYNAKIGVHLFKDGYIFDKDIKKKDNYGNGKVNTKNVKKYMTKFYIDYNDKTRELGGDYAYKDAADYYLRELPKIGLIPRFSFEVPESIYLEMCKAANVDPKHPKLGWKGEGNAWNPIDAESYYSLFCDYGMTDPKTGKWSPHKPIGNVDENGNRVFRLPDNAVQIVKDAVDKYSARRDKEESRINDVYEEFLKRSVKDGRLSEAEAQNLLSEISTDPNGGGEYSIKSDKQKQFDIISNTNPMRDDYHTGIRSVDDILTLQEAIEASKQENGEGIISTYPDVDESVYNEALQSGKIKVYSSKPIENGAFVGPSMMQAKDYAGGGKVYSKEVNVSDIAWINADEGVYANLGKRTNESVLDYAKRMSEETGKKNLLNGGSYFSGGGLLEEGLKGIVNPTIAVEYNKKVAGVYRNNFGEHIVTADVRDVDPAELIKDIDGPVAYFHASPVCKNFSRAKRNAEELPLDKETAQSTAKFISEVRPKIVTIENVKGYRNSEAMKIILDELEKQGYNYDADTYNAADYGAYTSRERLIVRAVRDWALPPKPIKMLAEDRPSGWLEAVADLIDGLPQTKNGVPDWMDVRLKAMGIDYHNIDKPLYVFGSGYSKDRIGCAFADELVPALRTKGGDIIIMPDGRVLKATPRVLARISGMSDDYAMPKTDDLAHTIVGNGIPVQLTKAVMGSLIENVKSDLDSGATEYSIIGKRGAANLDRRDESGIRADNLVTAEDMEKAGKDAKTIRMATGWERGVDGKWRYEIADAKLLPWEVWSKKRTPKLKDIVENADELFAAYPELEDVKVKKSNGKDLGGSFANDVITLEVGLMKTLEKYGSMDDILHGNKTLNSTLIHEIQHYIQDAEGFAQGGSSSTVIDGNARKKIKSLIDEINDDIDIYNSLPSNDPLKQRLNYGITDKRAKLKRLRGQHQLGYVGYHRLAGEVEARNAEKRLDMTEEERKNSLLVDTEDEGRDRQIVYGNAQPLPAANAKQSKSNSQLSATRFDLFEDIDFSISRSNRATIEGWLNKRNDLSDKERGAVIDYIDKLDSAQVQLATGKWFASGAIRIPEDMPKVEQAYKVAKKAKVDMLKYASPMELINANSEFKIKEARINPNDVKELKAARSIPQYGVEIFDVEDSQKGQQAMRKIINTHWGEDANPWCLLQGDGKGNLTEDSWGYWNHYNAYPKKVAFKDGKLLAFSANDSEDVVWWDRNDECHEYIPIVGKVPNDRYGRSALMEIHEDGQVDYSNYHIGSENKDGAYMLWGDGGELIQSGFYKDGKFTGWKQLGGYYEMHKDGESYYLDSNSYNDYYRVADANKLVYTKSISHSGTNEYTVKDWGGNGRENEHVTISKGKIISYQSKKVFFNENEIAKSYRVDDGDVKKIVNRLNTGKKEVTKDDVTYFLNADGTIEKEIHKIPYRSFYAVAYRRPDGNVQHIETIDNRGNRTGWVRYFYTTDGEKRTEPLDKLYDNGYPYNTKVIPSDRIEFDKKWINIDFIAPKDLNLAIEKTIKDADKYIESRAKVIVDEVESKVSKVGNIEAEVEQMKKRDIDALNQKYAEYSIARQRKQMLDAMTPEERAEYEAKEQWRKDNAAAITSSFFAERRADKADKIQALKNEINKLIKETRATNKENSEKVKEIAKEMQAYIKENIPTETQGDMTRTQFEQVIKQLSTAITRKDLEKPMRMVEYIGANANRRALTRQMRDFLKQGFKGMTPKGLVKAKNVDGATSRVLGLAKSLYESMGKQPLGSDLRALQTKVRGIKAELEDLNNANDGAFSEYVEQINAILKKSGVDRYEEMTKYYNELSDREDVGEIQVSEVLEHINRMLPELFSIELVKEQRTQAKADSAMTTKEDLEQLKNNLEDKREKGILSEEDQAVLDNMAMYELMVDLQQRQLDIDGPGASSIASQMAAKVREAKQYRDELEKYDDKKSGIAKNLKDNIKRVNAEMEELFVQRTQAQKEVNANVAELLDNLKQLRDTGNSALKEWSKNKQERETRIVNMANASFGKDARGYWSEVDRRGGWKRDFSNKMNNLRLAALMSPALSFEYMVGVMDPRFYTNESPIYKQFIKGEDGLIKANDNFFEGLEAYNNGINEAVERFINRNAMQSLKEYFNRGDRFATEIIPFEFEVKENVNGEVVTSIVHRDAEMTRGRAAKIYAWSRMADGMAKLKAHGVTDETLEVVKAFIGQDYMDFIDWVEDEYFPKLRREKYNPIYKKMYGISMAENEHYFPFETYKKDIRTEKELEQINSDNLGGGIVGNIIERKRNNARLDFTDESPDIFDAISEYGRKMEEWAAYAQVREDLKKVINNKQFKQHCDMLGTNYYNHFLDAARVASRLYNPQPSAPQLQSAAAKLQKVFASAAISLRVSTALKQLLSAPAFSVYSLDPAFHKELLKTASVIDVESAIKGLRELANGNKAEAKRLLLEENWVGHYNWCVNNLPSFRERVSKGGAGNPILEEKGWGKFSDDVQSVGMLPNRLVDAFTCSVGAKAIYEYAFNKYKKTYDKATAHNMAVTDAEIAFNSSQQSSNPVFLSPLQSSKEFWLRGIMNYKNSPIGYYRAGMKANIDLYRATKALFGKPKFTVNGEQAGFEGNGVNPAAKAAEAAAKSIMFNFFLNYLWAFGTIGIAGVSYTMMNNDNENGNMLYTDEEFDKATGGNMGLAVFNAATQGIPWISGFASVSQTGQDYTPSILFSEMNSYLEQVNKEGFMSLATAQLLIDLGLKNAIGVDPEVWGQIYRGAQGIMADRPMRVEDFMNLLASPRSAIAGVAKQKVGEYNNMQDYVNARIESEREIGIDETMDLGKKLTGLRPLRKSKLDGYIDEYLADKIPDYRELANKPDEKAKEERMEESNAFKNLNTLVATVQHTEEKKKSSKKIDGNEETKDKVKKIRKAVNVIHKLYASGDASSAQRIADELERRLKRGYNENGATLDDKLKNVDIYDSTGTSEQRGTDGFDTMFDRAMLGGFDGVYLGSKLD